MVRGLQTAIVTGKAGEEIWTDEHGRVKVQFHWDREGQRDENSSCWVRVSQAWAGAGFGAMVLPRIGQEVIVDFLEGNPDWPMITGRVYNGQCRPPYDLPGASAQSGLKSNSTKGGGGSNELRFDDTKGQEEAFFHAQKDYNAVVENDKTEQVKNNETLTVTSNRTREVGADETVTVKGNRTATVNGDESLTVGGNRTRQVSGNEEVTIVADQTVTITGGRSESVMTGDSLTITGGDREVTAAAGTYKVTAMKVEIVGMTEISLTVGGSFVKIDPSGVTIFGPMVKLN